MKRYFFFLVLLLAFLFCSAAHARGRPRLSQPASPWLVYKWGNGGHYRPFSTVDGTFTFPIAGNNVAYPAFLTTTTIAEHLGALTGQTVSATITVTTTGNPDFVWGGLLSGWNTCCLPANVRLFISSSAVAYSNSGYKACPSCYWWSANAWLEVSPSGNTTITAALVPSQWSNAIGQSGSSQPVAFANAVANVRQIGLAFGGGSFYDVGVAIQGSGSTAAFHLIAFNVQ